MSFKDWEPAIEEELRYLAKTALKGQRVNKLEGRGSAELPMWHYLNDKALCQDSLNTLLCATFPWLRLMCHLNVFFLPVNNYIYESESRSKVQGLLHTQVTVALPVPEMTLKYSWRAQQPTVAHTSWGRERISNRNITAENSHPTVSITRWGQKLLNSSLP